MATNFALQIRSEDEVRMDLTTRLHEESAMYTLVIGAEANTLVGLLPNADSTPIDSMYLTSKKVSGGILSASVSRTFWIRWQNRNIEFGRGGLAGEEQYFSYSDDGLSSITRITGYYVGQQTRAWLRFIETEGKLVSHWKFCFQ